MSHKVEQEQKDNGVMKLFYIIGLILFVIPVIFHFAVFEPHNTEFNENIAIISTILAYAGIISIPIFVFLLFKKIKQ